MLDPQQHALGIDIADLERDDLGDAQSGAVCGGERQSHTTSCVCLELRPLPSPGITRLQRYCEPLRHPSTPRPSLTGVWLIIPDHALGFPVLRALSLCTCCRHYPGAAEGRIPRSYSPIRISLPRKGCRVGLHIVLFEIPWASG